MTEFIQYQQAVMEDQSRQMKQMAAQIASIQTQLTSAIKDPIPPTISIDDQISQHLSDISAAVTVLTKSTNDDTKYVTLHQEVRSTMASTQQNNAALQTSMDVLQATNREMVLNVHRCIHKLETLVPQSNMQILQDAVDSILQTTSTTYANAEAHAHQQENAHESEMAVLHQISTNLTAAMRAARDYANMSDTRGGYSPTFDTERNTPFRTPLKQSQRYLTPNPHHSSADSPLPSPPTGFRDEHNVNTQVLNEINQLQQSMSQWSNSSPQGVDQAEHSSDEEQSQGADSAESAQHNLKGHMAKDAEDAADSSQPNDNNQREQWMFSEDDQHNDASTYVPTQSPISKINLNLTATNTANEMQGGGSNTTTKKNACASSMKWEENTSHDVGIKPNDDDCSTTTAGSGTISTVQDDASSTKSGASTASTREQRPRNAKTSALRILAPKSHIERKKKKEQAAKEVSASKAATNDTTMETTPQQSDEKIATKQNIAPNHKRPTYLFDSEEDSE